MKRSLTWAICCLGLVAAFSHAETVRKAAAPKGVDLDAAAKATAALYANTPATPPAPAPAAARALKSASVAKAVALPAQPPRSSPLLPPPAEPVQTMAAQQATGEVWEGAYHCEHAEKVQLRPDTVADQVELQWKGLRWKMRRIDSRSGAMRLEDATARMVWIQLANKSMLLDQRQGRRLLDECQHDVQVQTAAQMKNNPPPALFDTTGMGR